jgi:thiol-disulfide isomerase/thioredoxin
MPTLGAAASKARVPGWVATVGVVALLTVGACTRPPDPGEPPRPPSPFAACPETSPAVTAPARDALPAVTLPCFTDGAPVTLAGLGRPAVINLWASWCAPCREELPALQAFADEANGRVLVVGVITDDVWDRAAWAGIDYGVRFPSVFDPDRTLLRELGRPGLPVTLFVAADGSVRATDVSGSLTVAASWRRSISGCERVGSGTAGR